MPNAKTDEGKKLAKRIDQMIIDWNKSIQSSDPMLGLSIGVYASGSKDLSMIIREADRELYLSKYFRKKHNDIVSTDQMRSYLQQNFSPKEE